MQWQKPPEIPPSNNTQESYLRQENISPQSNQLNPDNIPPQAPNVNTSIVHMSNLSNN